MAKRSAPSDTTRKAAVARPLLLGLLLAASVAVPVLGLGPETPFDIYTLLLWGPFVAVGCLLLVRAGWHRMGWLLMVTGLALAMALHGVPGVPVEIYLEEAGPWTTVFALFTYITLVFPTGHLDSWTGRRAPVARLVVVVLGVFALTDVVGHIMILIRGEVPIGPVWEAVFGVAYIGTLLLLIGGAVSLVLRFRRSRGERRAQLSWVVASLTLIMVALILTELSAIVVTEVMGMPSIGDDIYFVVGVSFVGVPVAIMVAILRYRLYDLGRLVRRSVSYTVVVVVLAAVYSLGVLGLSSLIGSGSPLVVAGSTLAAAAVFNPVRHRVQRWVDRRFDRQRYDAQRLVDEFSDRLRDQTELEALIPDLTGVIDATLRPASISLWLKDTVQR